ncbi:MAG TPA: family 10 glycosylhydrolase [Actinopolymorphaceae bacterium]
MRSSASRVARTMAGAVAAAALLATATTVAAPAVGRAATDRPEKPRVQEQWRSFWVDSFHDGIYTPQQVDELVADAEAANANVLIVQVGRWMDCFCNRSTFPRTHAPIDPEPFDPLDDVIAKAHAAGIQVHAWVNASPMWNAAYPPPQPDHIYHTHGPTATGADRWLQKKYDGSEIGGTTMRVLDLTNPAATDYVVEGIASIAREYDIDGINLDYIRFPDYNSVDGYSDWGYSDVALQRFRAATGRTDVPEPSDEEFTAWRREQVTAYVRKIYLTMYAIDPKLRLSINGITYMYGPQSTPGGWEGTRTYRQVLQDWKGWLEEGIIDTNVAMNYKRASSPGHLQMFDEWNEVLADWQNGRQNVVGPGIYLNPLLDNLTMSRRALRPTAAGNRLAGWSGYSYAVPSSVADSDGSTADEERAALVSALTTNDPTGNPPLFAEKAKVPSMPWKERPTKGNIVGSLALKDGTGLDQVPVTLTNLRTGERVTGRVTDGSGWFGFVDLDPGLWLVRADLPRGVHGKSVDLVNVRKGKIAEPRLGPFRSR